MVLMARTVSCTAEFTVSLPPERTMSLFTAEGEREWAGDGWDPQYPASERQEGPGAVFTTYDLTALSAAGEHHLEAFEAGYDAEIASWGDEIARAIARREPA